MGDVPQGPATAGAIPSNTNPAETNAYLVGGGIASLASAAYLIHDGRVPAGNITIFEHDRVMGGSLDGQGSPDNRYVIRGGRMFTEEAYTCTFDLLSFIPSVTDASKSVTDEISSSTPGSSPTPGQGWSQAAANWMCPPWASATGTGWT